MNTAAKAGTGMSMQKAPHLIEGSGSISALPEYIRAQGVHTVLIVTDHIVPGDTISDMLLAALHAQGITYAIYTETCRDATSEHVEEVAELYRTTDCEGIIAFGSESCIACGKAAAARISQPFSPLKRLAGKFGIRRRMVPLYAVPTVGSADSATSGEALVTDSQSNHRFSLRNPCLIPDAAIFDSMILTG
ncbi:MAG: iron-containing alcohol dehydrogenase [Spirochaeta sp.]